MMTPEILKYIDSSVLCWLATVDSDGMPNVSPKEIWTAHGNDGVLVANIASPTSIQNIQAHAKVCLSFVDVFVQKGYKLKGTACIVMPKDADFSQLNESLEKMTEGKFPIHSIIFIQVERTVPIVAPSYRLNPDTKEADQIDSALKTYGVSRS